MFMILSGLIAGWAVSELVIFCLGFYLIYTFVPVIIDTIFHSIYMFCFNVSKFSTYIGLITLVIFGILMIGKLFIKKESYSKTIEEFFVFGFTVFVFGIIGLGINLLTGYLFKVEEALELLSKINAFFHKPFFIPIKNGIIFLCIKIKDFVLFVFEQYKKIHPYALLKFLNETLKIPAKMNIFILAALYYIPLIIVTKIFGKKTKWNFIIQSTFIVTSIVAFMAGFCI